eukprot:5658475-Heterocapsa_arctica.AAC.1
MVIVVVGRLVEIAVVGHLVVIVVDRLLVVVLVRLVVDLVVLDDVLLTQIVQFGIKVVLQVVLVDALDVVVVH